jgi:hypothetical protein
MRNNSTFFSFLNSRIEKFDKIIRNENSEITSDIEIFLDSGVLQKGVFFFN